jgi:hypothetical protein
MAYHVMHIYGDMDSPPLDSLGSVLDELSSADQEHFDVALSHESGWTLSVSSGGRLIIGNDEERGTERHVTGFDPMGADREAIIRLWVLLAQGGVQEVLNALPWKPGYQ